MSGLGFKSWVAGDVLEAAELNGYLMSQAVMVFADAAARTTALTFAEGMVTYLEDTDQVEKYDGTAWVPVGGVVVAYATAVETTFVQGTTDFNSVSISYAAKSASNRLIIEANFQGYAANTGANVDERAVKARIRNTTDSTDVVPATTAGRKLIATSTQTATEQPNMLLRAVITAGSTSSKTYVLEFLPFGSLSMGALGNTNPTRISVTELLP